MELHRWKDIREKKLSPEQLRRVDDEVEQELLKMDLRELGGADPAVAARSGRCLWRRLYRL